MYSLGGHQGLFPSHLHFLSTSETRASDNANTRHHNTTLEEEPTPHDSDKRKRMHPAGPSVEWRKAPGTCMYHQDCGQMGGCTRGGQNA